MVDSHETTHRGQMNEMYGIVDRSRLPKNGSFVPIFIGFALIIGLLLMAAFLGTGA